MAFKIPRSMVSISTDRLELSNSGVYLLIGRSDDQLKEKVYIGESEDVLSRLNQHIANGEHEWQDWSECVVFVSKDNQLNKAMKKYLESSLYDLAKTADRCELNNSNRPRKSTLSELDSSEMEEYLDNLRLLMGTMGYRFLEPSITKEQREDAIIFHYKSKRTECDAKGIIAEDGFVVLKGSIISNTVADSFVSSGYNSLRQKLITEGTIKERTFVKDHLFSSYSAAAAVVAGYNVNGWLNWKDDNGNSINDHFSDQ